MQKEGRDAVAEQLQKGEKREKALAELTRLSSGGLYKSVQYYLTDTVLLDARHRKAKSLAKAEKSKQFACIIKNKLTKEVQP